MQKSFYQKGSALYFTVVIMTIIFSLVLGVNAILTSQIIMIRDMGESVIAFHAANSGVEHTLYEVRKGDRTNIPPEQALQEMSFDGRRRAFYEVNITTRPYDVSGFVVYEVRSYGSVSYLDFMGGSETAKRAIEVEFVGRER